MLVGGIVVGDQMEVQCRRRVIVEVFEKAQKFLVAMAWLALRNHATGDDVEGREQGRKAHYWAICLGREGRVIGTCDLSEIDQRHRCAEVGFIVAREYWGKGYAFEAMQTVIEYAVRSEGIERFNARTHAENERSAVLLKRLGFVLGGMLRGYVKRDGVRRDCWFFGCRSSEIATTAQ